MKIIALCIYYFSRKTQFKFFFWNLLTFSGGCQTSIKRTSWSQKLSVILSAPHKMLQYPALVVLLLCLQNSQGFDPFQPGPHPTFHKYTYIQFIHCYTVQYFKVFQLFKTWDFYPPPSPKKIVLLFQSTVCNWPPDWHEFSNIS